MEAPNCPRHSVIGTLPLGSKSQRRSHDHSLWSAGSAGNSRISPLDGGTTCAERRLTPLGNTKMNSKIGLVALYTLLWSFPGLGNLRGVG